MDEKLHRQKIKSFEQPIYTFLNRYLNNDEKDHFVRDNFLLIRQ